MAGQTCARPGCSNPVPERAHPGSPQKHCSEECQILAKRERRNARRRAENAEEKAASRAASDKAFGKRRRKQQAKRAEVKEAAYELGEIRREFFALELMGDCVNGRPVRDGLVLGYDRLRNQLANAEQDEEKAEPAVVADDTDDSGWAGEIRRRYPFLSAHDRERLLDRLRLYDKAAQQCRAPYGDDLGVMPQFERLKYEFWQHKQAAKEQRAQMVLLLLNEPGNQYLRAIPAVSADSVEELGGKSTWLGCARAIFRAALQPPPPRLTSSQQRFKDVEDVARIKAMAKRRGRHEPADPLRPRGRDRQDRAARPGVDAEAHEDRASPGRPGG